MHPGYFLSSRRLSRIRRAASCRPSRIFPGLITSNSEVCTRRRMCIKPHSANLLAPVSGTCVASWIRALTVAKDHEKSFGTKIRTVAFKASWVRASTVATRGRRCLPPHSALPRVMPFGCLLWISTRYPKPDTFRGLDKGGAGAYHPTAPCRVSGRSAACSGSLPEREGERLLALDL